MSLNQKISDMFKQRETELIQVYIKERQNHGNKLGAMFLIKDGDKLSGNFLPIDSPYFTPEVRKDIESKNNYRNSICFFYIIEGNNTILIMRDLDNS